MSRWARHTRLSEPGRHRWLLQELDPLDVAGLCATARNVIGHYRAELPDLPEHRRDEVDSRWLEVILERDQARHRGRPLGERREPSTRVAGCCRDHALFVVGGLREHGIPARTRIGFADYLVAGHAVDHVVAEYWDGDRWRRVDPEAPGSGFDATDIPHGPDAPFRTAAQVWHRLRNGDLPEPHRYCVTPGSTMSGPSLIRTYVIYEVAHRCGDELLLWDEWGVTAGSGEVDLIDTLAALLIRADDGDDVAERELARLYAGDHRIRPGHTVIQHSPYGRASRRIDLGRRVPGHPAR